MYCMEILERCMHGSAYSTLTGLQDDPQPGRQASPRHCLVKQPKTQAPLIALATSPGNLARVHTAGRHGVLGWTSPLWYWW